MIVGHQLAGGGDAKFFRLIIVRNYFREEFGRVFVATFLQSFAKLIGRFVSGHRVDGLR
jgi:hypothetical protein